MGERERERERGVGNENASPAVRVVWISVSSDRGEGVVCGVQVERGTLFALKGGRLKVSS